MKLGDAVALLRSQGVPIHLATARNHLRDGHVAGALVGKLYYVDPAALRAAMVHDLGPQVSP